MLDHSELTPESRVLDIGCGNGNTAIWPANQTKCSVVGIDLSGVRIENAKIKSKEYPLLNISFYKASVTDLPFLDEEFSHIWSQATLYHVHDRPAALSEISRVLKEGGIFIFDDLISPKSEISASAQKYVYERLLFTLSYSHKNYTKALSDYNLMVYKSKDLNAHLEQSYDKMMAMAKQFTHLG